MSGIAALCRHSDRILSINPLAPRLPELSMPLSDNEIITALKGVIDPNTGKDLVAGKAVKSARVTGDQIAVDIQLGYPAKSQYDLIRKLAQDAIAALPGAGRVAVSIGHKIVSHAVQ